jgi:hypothetical protein
MLCDADLCFAPMREPENYRLLAIRREIQPHQPIINFFRAKVIVPDNLQLINQVQLMSCRVRIRYNKEAQAIRPKLISRDLNFHLKKTKQKTIPHRLQLTFPVPLCRSPNCKEYLRKISYTLNNCPLKKKCPCLVSRKHSLRILSSLLQR